MYLPVTHYKNKHRKALNLLDIPPPPPHGPNAKQHKVGAAGAGFLFVTPPSLCGTFVLTPASLASPTAPLICTCLETPRATRTLRRW